MNRSSRLLLAVLAICVAGSPISVGFAATIVQSQGFVGTPSLNRTVEFDRFNPSRGELVSAEWRLILDIEGGERSVDNDSDSEKTVEVYLGARASLSSLDVALVDSDQRPIIQADSATLALSQSTFRLAMDDGDGDTFDTTGPDSATHFGKTTSSFSSGIVDPKFLGDYIGTEMFELRVEIEQALELSPASELSDIVTPVTAWPNVQLVYHYHPVPEPTGILALSLGFVMLLGSILTCRRVLGWATM